MRFDRLPALDEVAKSLGGGASIHAFPLPRVFADRNMRSGWGEPEIYLNAEVRQNTSGFALADGAAVERGLKRLEVELNSGEWDKKHGALRTQSAFDAGFRLMRFGAS